MHRILLAALVLAVVPSVQAQDSTGNTFTWDGQIPQGSWLHVRNINGGITVEGASGNSVHVTGEKHWRHGDPSQVHFTVFKTGSDVTICALWHEGDTCDEDGYHSHHHGNNDNNDVSVHFAVQLPKGVKMDAHTVNGGLDIHGAQAEVEAETVNGDIEAATTMGPVNASTVNGSVRVSMDSLTGDGDLSFTTVNGSVRAELPTTLNAELEMSTVNGSFTSDYPLTVSGRLSPRHIRATIGNGGRRIRFETVNGSVQLLKR